MCTRKEPWIIGTLGSSKDREISYPRDNLKAATSRSMSPRDTTAELLVGTHQRKLVPRLRGRHYATTDKATADKATADKAIENKQGLIQSSSTPGAAKTVLPDARQIQM